MRRHLKGRFRARCVRVVDGDTIDVNGLGFSGQANEVVRIRLDGIDAPEMVPRITREGLAAQQFLQGRAYGEVVDVIPRRAWTDPYGRIIATVFIVTCHQEFGLPGYPCDISTMMLRAGYATPYKVHGRRVLKLPTCPLCGTRHVLDGSVLCGPGFLIV